MSPDENDECYGSLDTSSECFSVSRRMSLSLDSLPSSVAIAINSNRKCSTCSIGPLIRSDFRLCSSLSVEHILCHYSVGDGSADSSAHVPFESGDMYELCSNFKLPKTNLAKFISNTSDYTSNDNSPELFKCSNPRKLIRYLSCAIVKLSHRPRRVLYISSRSNYFKRINH